MEEVQAPALPVAFGAPKLRSLICIFASLGFVGLSYLFFSDPDRFVSTTGAHPFPAEFIKVFGIIGMGGFSLAALAWLELIIRKKPLFVFTKEGIQVKKHPLIFWQDIVKAEVFTIQRHSFIALTLKDEAAYEEKLSPLQKITSGMNKALGCSSATLSTTTTGNNAEQLISWINYYKNVYGAGNETSA